LDFSIPYSPFVPIDPTQKYPPTIVLVLSDEVVKIYPDRVELVEQFQQLYLQCADLAWDRQEKGNCFVAGGILLPDRWRFIKIEQPYKK
jgi:hypothetical protein